MQRPAKRRRELNRSTLLGVWFCLIAPAACFAEAPVGALVVCGGGDTPAVVFDTFIELAGGPERAKLVVIPSASEDADREDLGDLRDAWVKRKLEHVTILHTRSRERANDPKFVEPLQAATAVWISGGDQVCVTDAYLDTAVERELYALVRRGGVIGGTSAGAAVQSRVMIRGGYPVADVGRGFDLLPGAVVDQHFLKRNRLKRLLGVLATRPELVGLGVDEGTALVVKGKKLSVVGDSYVVVCRASVDGNPVRLDVLKSGDEWELKEPIGRGDPAPR